MTWPIKLFYYYYSTLCLINCNLKSILRLCYNDYFVVFVKMNNKTSLRNFSIIFVNCMPFQRLEPFSMFFLKYIFNNCHKNQKILHNMKDQIGDFCVQIIT